MVSFAVKGGLREGRAVLQRLKHFKSAESLGGVEFLVELPAAASTFRQYLVHPLPCLPNRFAHYRTNGGPNRRQSLQTPMDSGGTA